MARAAFGLLILWWSSQAPGWAQTDGSLDPRFHPGAGASDDVLATALLPAGGVMLGGYFTTYDGRERWRLARAQADGTLEARFDPGDSSGSSPVTRLAALPGGKILAAGAFSRFGGLARPYVVRLQPDGKVDETFDAAAAFNGQEGRVSVLAVLPDGKLLIGGRFDASAGSRGGTSALLRRLGPDGGLDPTFRAGLPPNGREDQLNALVVDNDGRLWVGTRATLACLRADGSVDKAFRPPTDVQGSILALALQTDGKLLAASRPETGGWRLQRLEPDGRLDATFHAVNVTGPEAGTVTTLLAQADGKILLGGSFREIGGKRRHGLARLQADGSLDLGFDPGTGVEVIPFDEAEETPVATVQTLLLLPEGGLLVAGRFDLYNGVTCHNLVRLYNGLAAQPAPSPAR